MHNDDQRLVSNLNKKITDAMFEFQKATRDEEDYNAVALGIWYLLISIYRRTPNWKKVIGRHLQELMDEVEDEHR